MRQQEKIKTPIVATSTAIDDDRWAAVMRRENVRFHATIDDAERDGFRPCKRCRPNERPLAEQYAAVVAKACRVIESTDTIPSLDELASVASMSRFHFHRVFKAITGVTPRAYAAAHRTRRVRDELSHVSRNSTVTRAIYEAGFNSSGRFYATSSAVPGMTPTRFRTGGDGTVIRFTAGECSLGSFVVATSEAGICAILLVMIRTRWCTRFRIASQGRN